MRKTLMVTCAASLSFSACVVSDQKMPQKRNTAAPTSSKACAAGEVSVPGSANDPCPQNDPTCVAAGGKALTNCEQGRWNDLCACIVPLSPPTITGAAGRAAAPTSCGDGLVQAEEQCDGKNLNGLTCKSLNFAGGQLQCGPVCTVDTTLCRI